MLDIPNVEQAMSAYIACVNLTKMFLPVQIIRIDERTRRVFILAGEETMIVINREGRRRFI